MDHAMADDSHAADGEEFLLDDSTDEIQLSELDASNLPAAKKACVDVSNDNSPDSPAAGSASLPGPSEQQRAPGLTSTIPRGSQVATATIASLPRSTPAVPAAAPSRQQSSLLASPTAGAALLVGPGKQAPPRPLRRPRLVQAGPALLPRRRRVVDSLLLPEAGAEAIRADILLRLGAMLKGHMFASGTIPSYDATSGEPLRVPRRSYARLLFSWPSADDAVSFRNLFPLTLRLANSRSVLLEVFEDPDPEFTAAKAAGATTLSIRNVPTDYEPEDNKAYLLAATTDDGLPWLSDLQHLHQVKDPNEGVAFTILDGIPIPSADDPHFQCIPAAISLNDGGPPMLLNFSSHACRYCAKNHRDADHASFAARRRQRLNNRAVISVAQLQQTNGQILGTQSAPTAVRNDPGLLLIGLDSEVEPWTCVLCDFQCGHALGSAMAHIASPTHSARLRATSHLPAAKDKYNTWHAMTLLENPPFSSLWLHLRSDVVLTAVTCVTYFK
ncbi:unnamed protein product [Closterium sp. Yama58-4]|nr:unnamed protein product [Closterium sp. Yama58-4]